MLCFLSPLGVNFMQPLAHRSLPGLGLAGYVLNKAAWIEAEPPRKLYIFVAQPAASFRLLPLLLTVGHLHHRLHHNMS